MRRLWAFGTIGALLVLSGCPAQQAEEPTKTAKPVAKARPGTVVLVDSDDHLNVRSAAGSGNKILYELSPGAAVEILEDTASVSGRPWRKVRTSKGDGWVNSKFITYKDRDTAALAKAVSSFASELSENGTTPISSRGLLVIDEGGRRALQGDNWPQATLKVDAECAEGKTVSEHLLEPIFELLIDGSADRVRSRSKDTRVSGFSCMTLFRAFEPKKQLGLHRYSLCFDPADGMKLVALVREKRSAEDNTYDDAVNLKPAFASTKEPSSKQEPPAKWSVVLVARTDVLNARSKPDPKSKLVFAFPHDATKIASTGKTKKIGSSTWRQVDTPKGAAWVNGAFVTPVVSKSAFAKDKNVHHVLELFSQAALTGGDLTSLVSSRGLYISHYGPLVRFRGSELKSALQSKKTMRVSGPACEKCMDLAPKALISDAFLDAWIDPERQVVFDQWKKGGNASATMPREFVNFRFVSIYDPGDMACLGLDWKSAVVFFEYENGRPKIAALTSDAWSP